MASCHPCSCSVNPKPVWRACPGLVSQWGQGADPYFIGGISTALGQVTGAISQQSALAA